MKYLKKIFENVLDVSAPIAIYNASEKDMSKKLIAVVDNMKLAARYIYGDTVDAKAPDKIRQKLKSGNLIKVGNSMHKYNIAVRNASLKQIEALGKNRWLFYNDYKSPWTFNDSKL